MNLHSWLDYIQRLHPTEIELGLERVAKVAENMGLDRPAPIVVTVGGTNGKGSCVALLEAFLHGLGYRVACYTSPHLHRFNERIRVMCQDVADDRICAAFEKVESARQDTAITYFEFTTLAALSIFSEENLDFVVLEVGLGGRLDAVNIIDADVAVITSIDLDHMDWLGKDRQSIGFEKSGILRPGKPVISAEKNPPLSLLERVNELETPYLQVDSEFGFLETSADNWCWRGIDRDGNAVTLDGLPAPLLHPDHVATSLQVLVYLGVQTTFAVIASAIENTALAGRFESLHDVQKNRDVILDVAHNPAAAARLASRLASWRRQSASAGKIVAVLAMMADKDNKGFGQALESTVDIWYIAQFDQVRSISAEKLAVELETNLAACETKAFENIRQAYEFACKSTTTDDLILVTGSFYTVAEIRKVILGLSD